MSRMIFSSSNTTYWSASSSKLAMADSAEEVADPRAGLQRAGNS